VRPEHGLDCRAPIFIIGCGRSGTTLLGRLLGMHPSVSYLYEPYDLWAAIDPATDFIQLYSHSEHYCMLAASSATAGARRRFRRLMSVPAGLTLVEKSPINALRIGYLDALAPDARFVHIVRDGVEVARSIEKMAGVTLRMAFRAPLNEWWGVGDAKWAALVRDGRAAGYYPDEVGELTTDAQRGAYEWLLSLSEVEAWRTHVASRLVELRYQDLTDDPAGTLRKLAESLGLGCPDTWAEQASAEVSSGRAGQGEPVALPPQMCADFNSFQMRFGLKGHAIVERSAAAGRTSLPVSEPRFRTSAPHPAQADDGIRVSRVSSLPEARTIVPEWSDLAETAGARNPFTHPDWLLPWAERFLRPAEPVWLLTARQQGKLVGVAPFYRRSWGAGLAHSMQLWGTGRHSDLTELPQVLLDPEHRRAIARALVAHLCANASAWDWATIPLEDPIWLEPEWLPPGGGITVLTKMVRTCVVLPVSAEGPSAMKRNVRESLRRARNRLDRAYPGAWSVSCATSRSELLSALPDLASLHDDRSRLADKKSHPNLLAQPAECSFLSEVLSGSAQRGGSAIYRLMTGGQVAAALLVLRSRRCTYVLLSGLRPWAWEFSPVTLLQGRAIDDAAALGHDEVNLSTGPDIPKVRWSEKLTVSPEFVLVPDRPFSRLAFGAYWQASAAAAYRRERRRHKFAPGPGRQRRAGTASDMRTTAEFPGMNGI
jgi:CelD/BcsL family acetyltransferase involved in cellulose biosynthesis